MMGEMPPPVHVRVCGQHRRDEMATPAKGQVMPYKAAAAETNEMLLPALKREAATLWGVREGRHIGLEGHLQEPRRTVAPG